MAVRRVRGALLRFARNRPRTIAAGIVLAAPAAWLEFRGGTGVWWIDGACLLAGATGAALVWAGVTGPRPDWID
jgi:hypothetical protein